VEAQEAQKEIVPNILYLRFANWVNENIAQNFLFALSERM
jgi:hypothetical protein